MLISLVSYIRDLRHGAKQFPWGLMNPKVVKGSFPNSGKGKLQKVFFDELLDFGFRRTRWQLVLPGQIAGIVKKIPKNEFGQNEHHIRFYEDGSIDCEVEPSRLNLKHWKGPIKHDLKILEKLLGEMSNIPMKESNKIKKLFAVKKYFQSRKKTF